MSTADGKEQKSLFEKITGFCTFMSLLFLVLLAGIVLSLLDLPPSNWVRNSLKAAAALRERQEMVESKYPLSIWYKTSRDERGLIRHDPSRAFPGYTVYCSGHQGGAIVVDMEGEEVYRWETPFSKIWPDPPHIHLSLPDRGVFARRAHIYPDGKALFLYETPMNTPSGCGLAKIDAKGRLIWKYAAHAHHDLCVGEDGTIYVLTQKMLNSPAKGWEHLVLPYVDDYIAILTPEGKEIKQFSILEAMRKAGLNESYSFEFQHTRYSYALHTNTVCVIGEKFASHYPSITEGDLMVCLRDSHLVAVINPESESVVWVTTGPWHLPHDPDPLENGRLLIFDNHDFRKTPPGSRVLEYDPIKMRVHWEYAGTSEDPLRSEIRSCQQLLPNGNVLITETDAGRIVEVTRGGEIVWEYVNPVIGGENNNLRPIICGARRYSAEELPFLSKSKNR